jgi:hypothetical protein
VCPLCALVEFLEAVNLADGVWRYTCSSPRHYPYVFEATASSRSPWTSTLVEELGVEDKLLSCLRADGHYEEYGILEYRFQADYPETYASLIRHYGHRALGTGKNPPTTTAILCGVLRTLFDYDDAISIWGPATGYWRYNTTISYGALPQAGVTPDDTLAWDDFAAAKGLDPDVWPFAAVGTPESEF